jgi:hypothetical protein
VLFDQCQPLLSDVRSFDSAEFPSELNVGVCSNQMELTNGGFHHGQFYTVESLVLELDEKGVEREEPVVSNESLVVDRCQMVDDQIAKKLGLGLERGPGFGISCLRWVSNLLRKKDEAHPLTGNFGTQTYRVRRRDPPRFDRGRALHQRLLIRVTQRSKFVSGAAIDVLVQVQGLFWHLLHYGFLGARGLLRPIRKLGTRWVRLLRDHLGQNQSNSSMFI